MFEVNDKFDIHKLRVKQNFTAFNTICKKEKLDFFLVINVVKLLQEVLKPGENFFDKRICFDEVKNKELLNHIIKKRGHLLLDLGEEAFCVKDETYFLLKEIYKLQCESDKKAQKYLAKISIENKLK